MDARAECVSCFVRQAAEAAEHASADPVARTLVLSQVTQIAQSLDLGRPPAAVGQLIHRRVRELTGDADPYRNAKRLFTQVALETLPALNDIVHVSSDPLWTAARLATAANVVDLAAAGGLTPSEVVGALGSVLSQPFHADWEAFRSALESAYSILYLTDNAGELVIDRLLIEQLGAARVTVAVRGSAVINDATRADALESGLGDLTDLAGLIDNGSDAPATLLDDCNPAFRDLFRRADMVIAKGQGNFETLNTCGRHIFCLFKVKCHVVAASASLPQGTLVLISTGIPGALASARQVRPHGA
jgi:uncharacterized protein with ATP-grasp and redox domains